MLRREFKDCAPHLVDFYVRQVPFFQELRATDASQFELLMKHSWMVELEPGEVLIEKGSVGTTFFALVEGELAVFPDKRPGEAGISALKPGQMLGVLSMINKEPRTATVAVSCTDGAVVLVTDFTVFGELPDCSRVKLETKLALFREVVCEIRATLDRYVLLQEMNGLDQELAMLDDFDGAEQTLDELEYLARQANGMAWLLHSWNDKVRPTVTLFDEDAIAARLASLMKLPHAPA